MSRAGCTQHASSCPASHPDVPPSTPAGQSCPEVAQRAQALLEQSLLNELRSCVARALSGLDLFKKEPGEEDTLIDDDTSLDGSSSVVRLAWRFRGQAQAV